MYTVFSSLQIFIAKRNSTLQGTVLIKNRGRIFFYKGNSEKVILELPHIHTVFRKLEVVLSLLLFIIQGFTATRCGLLSNIQNTGCLNIVQRKPHNVTIIEVNVYFSYYSYQLTFNHQLKMTLKHKSLIKGRKHW